MLFMCYLNWTEQGARAMKDAPNAMKRAGRLSRNWAGIS